MQLELESGKTIENPSDADIAGALPSEEYAILSDGPDSAIYLQFAENVERPWDLMLEYQEGTPETHFRATDSPISIELVIATFQKYARGDGSWKDDFKWEPMEV